MTISSDKDTTPEATMQVLSIDALSKGKGLWSWNQWYKLGEVPVSMVEWEDYKILDWFIAEGYLNASAKDLVTIEDDQYNLVVLRVEDGKPLFALEYGAQSKV